MAPFHGAPDRSHYVNFAKRGNPCGCWTCAYWRCRPSGRPTGCPEKAEITPWRWGDGCERYGVSAGGWGILSWRPRAGSRHGRGRYGVARQINVERFWPLSRRRREFLVQGGFELETLRPLRRTEGSKTPDTPPACLQLPRPISPESVYPPFRGGYNASLPCYPRCSPLCGAVTHCYATTGYHTSRPVVH